MIQRQDELSAAILEPKHSKRDVYRPLPSNPHSQRCADTELPTFIAGIANAGEKA